MGLAELSESEQNLVFNLIGNMANYRQACYVDGTEKHTMILEIARKLGIGINKVRT